MTSFMTEQKHHDKDVPILGIPPSLYRFTLVATNQEWIILVKLVGHASYRGKWFTIAFRGSIRMQYPSADAFSLKQQQMMATHVWKSHWMSGGGCPFLPPILIWVNE